MSKTRTIYERREFTPSPVTGSIESALLATKSMRFGENYDIFFKIDTGNPELEIFHTIMNVNGESQEEVLKFLATISEHAKLLRDEVLKLKFDEPRKESEVGKSDVNGEAG